MQLSLKNRVGNIYVSYHERYPNRPTIVFLHDSLGCIELWRDFPKKLSDLSSCNFLVYDRQGYGKSSTFATLKRNIEYLEVEADILKEILEVLHIKEAILFGHSDGGSIALIAAAKYPSPIIGIITEGAHIFVEELTLQGIQDAVKTYHGTNLKERLQKYHGEKTEAMFSAWTTTWLSDEFKFWNIENFLTHITCPVLVIQGENDEYGSGKQVDGIINQVSGNASKIIIPFVGHTPHKEAEELVLNNSADFISQLKMHS